MNVYSRELQRWLFSLALLGACGSSDARDSDAGSAGDAAEPPLTADAAAETQEPELAVSADFLNQTLSIVDLRKFKEGAKRSDVLVGSVDLSAYAPGPLAVAITPDGKTALVSVSPGFMGFFMTVPPGDGTLLFVDLASRKVVGELFTGKSPMGVVITPDGKRAFVGHFSETYFAVVDIEHRTFEKVETGAPYNEEFAIDDSGTVGILSYGSAGDVKTFSVADPRASLGQTTGLTGDAAGMAFFPGTKIAYLLQVPTSLNGNIGGHNLVNVANPAAPTASDDVRLNDAPIMYPATALKTRNSVAFPRTKDDQVALTEVKLQGDVAVEVQTVTVGPAKSLAYGVTEARDGRVLVVVPGEHYVGVVDLETKKAFTVPWEVTESGPVDIKLIP